jgi:hypothetical protein
MQNTAKIWNQEQYFSFGTLTVFIPLRAIKWMCFNEQNILCR